MKNEIQACEETYPVRWLVINISVITSQLCSLYYCYIYRLGLDPKVLMEIVNSSSGRCWSSEVYCPVPGTMDNVPSSSDYKVLSLIMP
jgi:3-hydroxyisobutyrate dehydrogenase-like beta-hydroxyacid dehydrogenase